jgi:hypothetical protein
MDSHKDNAYPWCPQQYLDVGGVDPDPPDPHLVDFAGTESVMRKRIQTRIEGDTTH